MSSFKQSATVLLFLFCVACSSFSKIQTANPLMTSAAMTSPPQNIASKTPYKLRPTRTLTPSFTPAPTNTPIPLDLSHLEITGLDLSIIPPPEYLHSVNMCDFVFRGAGCLNFSSNHLYQGSAARREIASLTTSGILGQMYADNLDLITSNHRVFVLDEIYLPEGFGIFICIPKGERAVSPAAAIPLDNDFYRFVFLVPKSVNVYILGLYQIDTGEIFRGYNISTGV